MTGKVREDVLQREREILRAFRECTNIRAKAEAETLSLRQTKTEEADNKLTQTREQARDKLDLALRQAHEADEKLDWAIKQADARWDWRRANATAELNKARKAVKDAEIALVAVGLQSELEQTKPASVTKHTGPATDAQYELANWARAAFLVADDVVAAAGRLLEWRGIKGWQLTKGYYRWPERTTDNISNVVVRISVGCVLLVPFLVTLLIDALGLVWFILRKLLLGNWHERDLTQQIERHILGLSQALAEAEAYCDMVLDQTQKEYYSTLGEIQARHAKSEHEITAEAQAESEREIAEAQAKYKREIAQAQAEYERGMAEAQAVYQKSWQRLYEESSALCQSLGLVDAEWEDPRWSSWVPMSKGNVCPYLRIGQLVEQGQWHRLSLPALLPVIDKGNVVVKCSGAAKDQAVQIVRSLMLRMLATTPPGKLRFTLVDPVGLGQSMAAFMSLADYDEALVGGKIWTKPQHIEEQLSRLTEHMEFVIQKFLRDKYHTIEDYNSEAGEVAEPYRALVIINFPVNFSESAARHLISIALNGPRCGVYTIITMDTDQQLPYGTIDGVETQDCERVVTSRRRKRREDYEEENEDEDEEDDDDY